MSCSGEWKVCRQTYFLVYTGVLVAASLAETSKETPEGQIVVCETCPASELLVHSRFAGRSGVVDASWVWDIVARLAVTACV